MHTSLLLASAALPLARAPAHALLACDMSACAKRVFSSSSPARAARAGDAPLEGCSSYVHQELPPVHADRPPWSAASPRDGISCGTSRPLVGSSRRRCPCRLIPRLWYRHSID